MPLIRPVMKNGVRLDPAPTLAEIRAHAANELAGLPGGLKSLEHADQYPVRVADSLVDLAREVDRRIKG
jgi:nicotinate phosphoribosyltransferase